MFSRPRTALLLYAVAMGYVEAAVVVYLRAIYYPEGFSFPLKPMDAGIVAVEIGREAATLVIVPAPLAGVTGLGEGVSLPAVSYPWWGWIAGESAALFVAVRWWMRGRRST